MLKFALPRRWPARDAEYWVSRAGSFRPMSSAPHASYSSSLTHTDGVSSASRPSPVSSGPKFGLSSTTASDTTLPSGLRDLETKSPPIIRHGDSLKEGSLAGALRPDELRSLYRRWIRARRSGSQTTIKRIKSLLVQDASDPYSPSSALLPETYFGDREKRFEEIVRIAEAFVQHCKSRSDELAKHQAIRSQQQVTAKVLGLTTGQQLPSLLMTQEKTNLLRSIERERARKVLRYTLYLLLQEPLGLPYAVSVCDLMIREGMEPDLVLLTTLLKRTLQRVLSHTEASFSEASLQSLRNNAFSLVKRVLDLGIKSDMHLFTLICSIHNTLHTPTAQIVKIVRETMAMEGRASISTWLPEAFDAVISAYGRDGDLQACRDWYIKYRDSDVVRESRHSEFAQPRPSTVHWPYVSYLHACEDSRKTRGVATSRKPAVQLLRAQKSSEWKRIADRLRLGRVRTILSIIRDMRRDNIACPIEVYNALMFRARRYSDYETGNAIWNLLQTGDDVPPTNLETFIQYLRLKSLENKKFPSRSPLRTCFRMEIGNHISRNGGRLLSVSATASQNVELLHVIIVESVSKYRQDFALALWAIRQYAANDLVMPEKTIDALAFGLLRFWSRKSADADWALAVLGNEAADAAGRLWSGFRQSQRSTNGPRPPHAIPDEAWSLLSRRICAFQAQEGQLAQLPLSLPRSVLDPSTTDRLESLQADPDPTAFDTALPPSLYSIVHIYSEGRHQAGKVLRTYADGLAQILEKCIIIDAERKGTKVESESVVDKVVLQLNAELYDAVARPNA